MPLKFFDLQETASIPFISDSTINLKRLSESDKDKLVKELDAKGIKDLVERADFILDRYITGWDKMEIGETKKPFPFNDENRKRVAKAMREDGDAFDKFLVFIKGYSGN